MEPHKENGEKAGWKETLQAVWLALTDWFDGNLFLNLIFAVLLVFISTAFFVKWKMSQEFDKQIEPALNTIYTYMATATDEEYENIASELRHSLILRTLDTEDQNYLDLIPNTATACLFDQENDGGIYLAALNTGELYPLEPAPDTDKDGHTGIRFGYDEVSRSNVTFQFAPSGDASSIYLSRENGEVSVQRMKRYFCEACFNELVEILTNKNVLEFVIFDVETQTIYPIVECAEYDIADHEVTITRDHGYGGNDYQITLSCAG